MLTPPLPLPPLPTHTHIHTGTECLGPCYITHPAESNNNSNGNNGVNRTISTTATTIAMALRQSATSDLTACAFRLDQDFRPIPVSDREKDVVRLRAYGAAIYAPAHLLPRLGEETATMDTTKRRVDHMRKSNDGSGGVKAPGKGKTELDDAQLLDLVKLVHGSKDGMDKLMVNFNLVHAAVPKAAVKRAILEVADKEKHAQGHGGQRWVVKTAVSERECIYC